MITTRHFHFDANQAWGVYPQDWNRIKAQYEGQDLRTAQADMRSLTPITRKNGAVYFMPSFGYRIEHKGITLGEWMQLYDLPYDVES